MGHFKPMDWKLTSAIVLLQLALVAASAGATQAGEYVPIFHPTLAVTRAAGPIKIDGELGDPGWEGSAKATNFAEHKPGDQTKPEVDTEVLVTYDDANLYAAFICYDKPGEVRASRCNRDEIFSDDVVFICLDTYGEASVAYEIAANPYGIQGDLLFSPANGEDMTYDLIYESGGSMTDFGWVVEMAVPFSSLRFPESPDQTWRMDFWRNRPRNTRYQYSWAAYDRDEPCWPCQWGTVTGISAVKPGGGLEILPSVVAHQSGARNSLAQFEQGKIKGDAGLGIAYDVSSELSLEGTINPDFSQVESDADQIDVNTTFALFYPEHRPFFQEGSDLFSSFFTAVYTRSINDPLGAAKLVWRKGGASIATLSARDEHSVVILPFEEASEFVENGRSYSNIIRARKDFGGQSYVGLVGTDRRFDDGGAGSLAGIDGQIRLTANNSFRFQVLGSRTEEIDNPALGDTSWAHKTFDRGRHTVALDGETFWGHAWFATLERETRNYEFGADYTEESPTFRADNGLEPSNDFRTGTTWVAGTHNFDESRILESTSTATILGQKWNFAGTTKNKWLEEEIGVALRQAQTNLEFYYIRDGETFGGKRFHGTWRVQHVFTVQPNGALTLEGNIAYGHRIARRQLVLGKELSYTFGAGVRPIDCLLASLSYSRAASDDIDTGERLFSQSIFRSEVGWQIARGLSARAVLQYNDKDKTWGIEPLLTYQLNPFSIFYIGSTYDYRDVAETGDPASDWTLSGRQYFMKLQYLFRT